jgi:hypothetical protein
MVVLLPLPLGPNRQEISPGWTSKLTSRIVGSLFSNCLQTFSTFITGSTGAEFATTAPGAAGKASAGFKTSRLIFYFFS